MSTYIVLFTSHDFAFIQEAPERQTLTSCIYIGSAKCHAWWPTFGRISTPIVAILYFLPITVSPIRVLISDWILNYRLCTCPPTLYIKYGIGIEKSSAFEYPFYRLKEYKRTCSVFIDVASFWINILYIAYDRRLLTVLRGHYLRGD